jgi:hypothetical protein
MDDISNVVREKTLFGKTKETASTIKEISMIIFEATARPDCIRGSSTWSADFVPVVGVGNYFRRMYDQVGLGPEMIYVSGLMAYQIAATSAIYKGAIELLPQIRW